MFPSPNEDRWGSAEVSPSRAPLGHGDLDWMELLAALAEIEYQGWIVVQREGGQREANDVQQGVLLLRRLLG